MFESNVCSWVNASYDGLKVARVQVSKVHLNGKINIIMEKKTLKINVEWALYGIIQLTKSICKVAHLENSLSCMLKGKRY